MQIRPLTKASKHVIIKATDVPRKNVAGDRRHIEAFIDIIAFGTGKPACLYDMNVYRTNT